MESDVVLVSDESLEAIVLKEPPMNDGEGLVIQRELEKQQPIEVSGEGVSQTEEVAGPETAGQKSGASTRQITSVCQKKLSKAGRPIKKANLNKDPTSYAQEQQSTETVKSTKYAVNVYNQTMRTAEGPAHVDLHLVPTSDLPKKLAKFFMLVTKSDGTAMNASSLTTIYQSLARFFSGEATNKVDIKSDIRFNVVRANLKAAQKASCKEGQVPGKMRAEAFQDQHIAKCWEMKTLGRENPEALLSTVHSICIMQLGFRAKAECYNLRNEDFIFGQIGKHGVASKIEVSERITKTRQGEMKAVRNVRPVVYPDHEHPDVCPVRTLEFYQAKKTEEQRAPNVRFFLGVKMSAKRDPELENYWFTSQAIGVNNVGKLMPSAFEAAGIDIKKEHISGTSGRKTAMEGGFQHSVPNNLLSGLAGHSNASSLTSYINGKEQSHEALSLIMSRKMGQKKTGTFGEVLAEVEDSYVPARDNGDTESEKIPMEPARTAPAVGVTQPNPLPQQSPISLQPTFVPHMPAPFLPLASSPLVPDNSQSLSYFFPQSQAGAIPLGLPLTGYQHHQQLLLANQLGLPVNPIAMMPPQQFFQPTLGQACTPPSYSGHRVIYRTQEGPSDTRVQQLEAKIQEQSKMLDEQTKTMERQRKEMEAKDREFAERLQRVEDEKEARLLEQQTARLDFATLQYAMTKA